MSKDTHYDKEALAELEQLYLRDSREFIDVLRIHRHDYLNHLQVIMGSIQLKRSDYALDYIKEVIDGLKKESRISNIKHPEVAALLLKKIHQAEEKAVTLEIDMESDLKGLKLPATDLVRIIGNLIDNALYAVAALTESDRKVEVLFAEGDSEYIIEVFNNKPVVPVEVQEKIFHKGFTTKGIEGSGLGLYIVKELVTENGGTIDFTSNEEEGTTFTIRFSKETCESEKQS